MSVEEHHHAAECTCASHLCDVPATLVRKQQIAADVWIITFAAAAIAQMAKPGNFVTIKVNSTTQPLLRRPFSIHNAQGSLLDVMVKNVGSASNILCSMSEGSTCFMLGALGNSFSFDSSSFDVGVLVSGGIGTAPMLFLQQQLAAQGKEWVHLLGGRTKHDVLAYNLSNCRVATDDGSEGFCGTTVDLLRHELPHLRALGRLQLFACGPNGMLRALATLCGEEQLACELSLEAVMGCGIGICYGCTVEVNDLAGGRRMLLLCQEGAVINGSLLI